MTFGNVNSNLWNGITFASGSLGYNPADGSGNILDNVLIDHASTAISMYSNPSPLFSNIRLTNTNNYGIYYYNSVAYQLTNFSIDSGYYGIYAPNNDIGCISTPCYVNGGSFSNLNSAIYLSTYRLDMNFTVTDTSFTNMYYVSDLKEGKYLNIMRGIDI